MARVPFVDLALPLAEAGILLAVGLIFVVAVPMVRPRWSGLLLLASIALPPALGWGAYLGPDTRGHWP